MRRRINRALRDRPCLTFELWFETFWRSSGISKDAADFTYMQLPNYSGIEFARVLPSDRLEEDLKLSLVCWFDWQLTLCDDFWQRFEVDISDRLDLQELSTVADLVVFLDKQLISMNRS